MTYFFKRIIRPVIINNKYKTICEIGSFKGENTEKLLTTRPDKIVVIDPCMDCDLYSKYEHEERVKVYRMTSLEALAGIEETFDCILIDGDHNWYTVFNELRIIEEKDLLNKGGTIFLHDVLWPYGRRDLYYMPETIPAEYRKPYKKEGIIEGNPGLVSDGGKNATFNNATLEVGPQNGVLTAIEDFLKKYGSKYMSFRCKQQHGLEVLVKKKGLLTDIMFVMHLARIRCVEYSRKIYDYTKPCKTVLYRLKLLKDKK